MRRIKVRTESAGVLSGILTDENPETSEAIWAALPIQGKANLWGDEIYYSTALRLKQEKARDVVDLGEIAYWPPGQAICIFFGTTPASRDGEIRAASPVNVVGRLENAEQLKRVKQGEKVTVERS